MKLIGCISFNIESYRDVTASDDSFVVILLVIILCSIFLCGPNIAYTLTQSFVFLVIQASHISITTLGHMFLNSCIH